MYYYDVLYFDSHTGVEEYYLIYLNRTINSAIYLSLFLAYLSRYYNYDKTCTCNFQSCKLHHIYQKACKKSCKTSIDLHNSRRPQALNKRQFKNIKSCI